MLATVKVTDLVEGSPQGTTEIVDVGVLDIRCATSIQTLVRMARSLTFGAPLSANLLDGVADHLFKTQHLIGTSQNPLPKKKGEDYVVSFKRFHHRKTKTYHTVTVTVSP